MIQRIKEFEKISKAVLKFSPRNQNKCPIYKKPHTKFEKKIIGSQYKHNWDFNTINLLSRYKKHNNLDLQCDQT